jgi:hypothetical protein
MDKRELARGAVLAEQTILSTPNGAICRISRANLDVLN